MTMLKKVPNYVVNILGSRKIFNIGTTRRIDIFMVGKPQIVFLNFDDHVIYNASMYFSKLCSEPQMIIS